MSNKRTAKAAFTVDDIVAEARLPEKYVSIPMAADLVAEHEILVAELEALQDEDTLAGASQERRHLAEAIGEVQAQVEASVRTFAFRALGRRKFKELLDAHPPRDEDAGLQFNADTFPRELLAACAIEPRMTPTDVDRVADVVNTDAYDKLFAAAWWANQGATRVPFSKAASEILGRTASK